MSLLQCGVRSGAAKKNTQKRWVDHCFSMVSGTPPLYQLKKTANFVLPSHEALFKGPTSEGGLSHLLPTKPGGVLACYSLPDGTISSVPIYDFADEHEELARMDMEEYYSCCGKSI